MADEVKTDWKENLTAGVNQVKTAMLYSGLVLLAFYGAIQGTQNYFAPKTQTPATIPVLETVKTEIKPVAIKKPVSWVILKNNKRITSEQEKIIEAALNHLEVGKIDAVGIPAAGDAPIYRTILVSDGTAPQPPPDKPIDKPVVTPKPDQPVIEPAVTIIPKEKFRVIIAYETSKPGSSKGSVSDPAIWSYLSSHCAAGNDKGKTPERRYFDVDTPLPNEPSSSIKALWNAAKLTMKTPCLIIGNDTSPLVFDLPDTPSETLKLIKKYGGE